MWTIVRAVLIEKEFIGNHSLPGVQGDTPADPTRLLPPTRGPRMIIG